MTAVYDKLKLHFLYPENWKLIDSVGAESEDAHVVSLESPSGSSTWTVHVYGTDVPQDEILKETIAALEETYDDVEIAPIEETVAGYPCNGVEALFYCLDFLVRARLLLLTTDEHTLLIWTQAEDRDFDQQAIVFSAISTSLLQGEH